MENFIFCAVTQQVYKVKRFDENAAKTYVILTF